MLLLDIDNLDIQ